MVEQSKNFAKLLVFPEGGTSNGKGLLRFKKGPFVAEKTVMPVFMSFDSMKFNPTLNLPVPALLFLQLC